MEDSYEIYQSDLESVEANIKISMDFAFITGQSELGNILKLALEKLQNNTWRIENND